MENWADLDKTTVHGEADLQKIGAIQIIWHILMMLRGNWNRIKCIKSEVGMGRKILLFLINRVCSPLLFLTA